MVLTLDFSHRVYLLGTVSYLLMDPKRGLFLTLQSGIMDLVRVPQEGGEFRVNDEPLRPYYKTSFEKALTVYTNSPLRDTATEKAKRALLGLHTEDSPPVPQKRAAKAPSEGHGYTLQDLSAEFGVDPGKLRATLRKSGVQKPGGKWEWANREEALESVNGKSTVVLI